MTSTPDRSVGTAACAPLTNCLTAPGDSDCNGGIPDEFINWTNFAVSLDKWSYFQGYSPEYHASDNACQFPCACLCRAYCTRYQLLPPMNKVALFIADTGLIVDMVKKASALRYLKAS